MVLCCCCRDGGRLTLCGATGDRDSQRSDSTLGQLSSAQQRSATTGRAGNISEGSSIPGGHCSMRVALASRTQNHTNHLVATLHVPAARGVVPRSLPAGASGKVHPTPPSPPVPRTNTPSPLQILTAEDAPLAVRLALHDAGTFDLASKKGGDRGGRRGEACLRG